MKSILLQLQSTIDHMHTHTHTHNIKQFYLFIELRI